MKRTLKDWRAVSFALAAGFSMLVSELAVRASYGTGVPAAPALENAVSSASPASPAPAKNVPAVSAGELSRDLLIESIVQVESSGKPHKVGAKGERGLMQIKRETWTETTREAFGRPVSFCRAFEPALNRQIGSAYLENLRAFIHDNRDAWKSDERSLLLACYNAGPVAVARAGFDVAQLPSSTRDYISRATALHDHFLREFRLPERLEVAGLNVLRNG